MAKTERPSEEQAMQDFEKLGTFYLGRSYDLAKKTGDRDALVLYDSKDLVTHAVCVGMTGSGKTGLCLSLLEEAAIDGIPAIIIDPKGDLSNLLLTFPSLRGSDFLPWISEEDAARNGVTPQQHADQQAALWAKGLADWGQDGARIQRLKDSADFSVYTPGSNAGLPVSILKSFSVPVRSIMDDEELLRERISSTATSLLALMGIDADSMHSREHTLLSTIFSSAWNAGKDLDLGSLIEQIQTPPVQRWGVMDIESVFPSKDRFALAMLLNNILAAPGFAAWMEGEPLDIGAALRTPTGKPRVSIYSIAHLNDAERMFFVSMLLNQMLGWVRTQSGTTSLRALLYMDEIAGYFPPTANPPSKTPLLMLMKQARAFGVGVVLATQNPVDLDYKGLANAGTWFIGRLQTERDKARVLDGLEGAAARASAGFDRSKIEKILSQLSSRVFLMNNVHEDGPEIFESRWAMSYLRGPLTRGQIKALMDQRRGAMKTEPGAGDAVVSGPPDASASTANGATVASNGGRQSQSGNGESTSRPVMPPEIKQCFLPIRGSKPAGSSLVYRASLLGCARVYYRDAKNGIDDKRAVSHLTALGAGPVGVDWEASSVAELIETDVESEPATGASFAQAASEAGKAKSYDAWTKGFSDLVYRTQRLDLLKSPSVDEVSKPDESERDFRARLQQTAREQRDQMSAKLRQKYAPKMTTLQERVRRAQQAAEVQQAQAKGAKLSTAISFGAAILSAFMGRKAVSARSIGKAASAARGVEKSMKESGDVGRANETVEALQRQRADLEAQFQAEVDSMSATVDPLTEKLETITLKPKKTDITVRVVFLAWAPEWRDGSGKVTAAWR